MEKNSASPALFQRGIFPTPGRAWLALAVYTALLYASVSAALDAYLWVYEGIGLDAMKWLLTSFYVTAGLALLAFLARRFPLTPRSAAASVLVGAAAVFLLSREDVPANRIHLAQYGPLAILALDGFRFRWPDGRAAAGALAAVFLIGCGDEFLQGLFPGRRFDPHDIFLNTASGALALAFVWFAIGPQNYPWGRRGGAGSFLSRGRRQADTR